MAKDPEQLAHQEWLGYVQPVGLVVSTPALLAAQAYINKNIIPEHQRFLEWVEPITVKGGEDTILAVTDLPGFLQEVLGWDTGDLVSDGNLDSLEVVLTEYGQTLRPAYAVKEIESDTAEANPWQMLIQTLPNGVDLDAMLETDDHKWQASAHAHFERLLRETKVPIGLLFNGTHFRLVYAPRGETSGWLTFPVDAMAQVDGRPIFAGLHLLLSAERLFTLPRKQRLPYLLAESRKYQNLVSTQLSEQVLHSLYELLRGFQAADDMTHGELLREVLKEEPNHVYAGLLNVLLRLVFVLYAEDRSLMPGDSVYTNFYSVNGLFERLRSDVSRFPDTMDQRYGAWAQLLSLFRLIHDGASHGEQFKLPPRHGHLFNPDRYPFLEGRPYRATRQIHETVQPPLVSDGIVFRVLHNLLILDGERISYRTLDVEQIGSVYETVMGFALEVAKGRSIAVKPVKPHGAPVIIDLDELLATKPGNRAKWVKDTADQSITGSALATAISTEDLVAALGKKLSPTTPRIVPPGAMILQPSDERRRSGSHYTPRSLTEPIVRTTLRPVLEQLGDKPTPEQILDLKVCDPAMGSGAFLVEADRQLADELVKAWHNHECVPTIPPDEDEVLFARRLVVQRCLYGVDKNPMAVDLAKLALWLATLARDHAFTFVDHALNCGDSLVGLTRKQIEAFDWKQSRQTTFLSQLLGMCIKEAAENRQVIRNASEDADYPMLRLSLAEADETLEEVRSVGNLILTAFFMDKTDKARNSRLHLFSRIISEWAENRYDLSPSLINDLGFSGADPPMYPIGYIDALCREHLPLEPFHWEIEFPEVFQRDNPGFDAFIGNPPFAGGARISTLSGMNYFEYLTFKYPPAGHQCDLVGYFFRRCYELLRQDGAMGLIATATIAQGDTRDGALNPILGSGGCIYNAVRRYKWPGLASVLVSPVHISKGREVAPPRLDGKVVSRISAFLFPGTVDDAPRQLPQNPYYSKGSQIYGQGFVFDDSDPKANPISVMQSIVIREPQSAKRILPFVGGEELNTQVRVEPYKYVAFLSDLQTEENLAAYPLLSDLIRRKVKPERDILGDNPNNIPLKKRWWAYQAHRPELYSLLAHRERVLAQAEVGPYLCFVYLPTDWVYSKTMILLDLPTYAGFACVKAGAHDLWTRFLASSLGDSVRYTASDCFATFPFPKDFESNPALEAAGKEYYEFRAALMVRNNEGLTKTYNRFHDPEEHLPDILRLRKLHAAMDRAVLGAYGWTDLQPTCEFLLDYEEDEDEDEAPTKGRGRKKPWRYRWPDDFRDEVLARLLELNRQYAESERLSGVAAEGKGKSRSTAKSTKNAKKGHEERQGDLF